MNRSKKLVTLLICLGILCIGTLLLSQIDTHQEEIKNTGDIVLAVSADEVQSLQWTYGGNTLAFHKEDGSWYYDEDESFPVDGDKIQQMLAQFEALGTSFVIENVTDLEPYGLDDPECVIEFATAEQTYRITVGDFSTMDEERYLSIGDDNVYLAKTDPLDEFSAVLNDMICHDKSLSYTQIQKITFNGAENYTISYQENSPAAYCNADVYFTEQNGEIIPLDTDRVTDWLESLTTLYLSDFVTYNATEEDLETYQLTEAELTITVDYTDSNDTAQTYTLSISRDREELAAAEKAEARGKEAEEVTAYLRVNDSQLVYRISEYSSNNLRAVSYDELRHREVLVADFTDVTQLDITLEETSYTLLADSQNDDDETIWRYNEAKVDDSTLQKKLEALKVTSASDFTNVQPAGKQELQLVVHLRSETRPTVTIDLYRQDGSTCLAVVDGVPFAFVSRSDVVDLTEAIHAIVLD